MKISPVKFNYIRKSKNISQEEFAARLGSGIKKANVSNWERGTKGFPVKYHQQICDILNVPIEELCDIVPEKRPVVREEQSQYNARNRNNCESPPLADDIIGRENRDIIAYYMRSENKRKRLQLLLEIEDLKNHGTGGKDAKSLEHDRPSANIA